MLASIAAGALPLNYVILDHTSSKRLRLDPAALAIETAMDHPDDNLVFAYIERNQNLALILRCCPDVQGRVAVVGLDDLEISPQPIGRPPRAPILRTSEKAVCNVLEESFRSS